MVWFSINHHKASPLGPISGLAVIAIAVLNGFKVALFAATTKLIATTSNWVAVSKLDYYMQ